MDPRINIITLGVSDLEASKEFYHGKLGWELSDHSNEGILFFKTSGTVFACYPKDKLDEDIGLTSESPNPRSFTMAYNVDSKEKVDATIEEARQAGATIQKEPQEVFWGGYSGYFLDPDGFAWEVAYNPYVEFDDRELLVMN